jgi:hypothetical protein
MKIRCVGFVRVRGGKKGWLPCKHRAGLGDSFCDAHRDALDGALLGLFGRHSLFRDDPYAETQTVGVARESGERRSGSDFTPSADTSASGGDSPPANAAAGQRARKKRPPIEEARANWRRAAAKWSR